MLFSIATCEVENFDFRRDFRNANNAGRFNAELGE
jgi:hypothetical protein